MAKKHFITIGMIMLTLVAIITYVSLNKDKSVSKTFYNEGFIIATDVFSKTDSILRYDDINTLLETKSEIEALEANFETLKTNEDTKQGEEALEKIFKCAYEAIELFEGELTEGQTATSHDAIISKLGELTNQYRDYNQVFSDSGIEMQAETAEESLDRINTLNSKE